jgi:hypothetical protein
MANTGGGIVAATSGASLVTIYCGAGRETQYGNSAGRIDFQQLR